jgi:hypothetical protein
VSKREKGGERKRGREKERIEKNGEIVRRGRVRREEIKWWVEKEGERERRGGKKAKIPLGVFKGADSESANIFRKFRLRIAGLSARPEIPVKSPK